MSLVAGIGCRRGATAEDILAAIDAAMMASGRSRAELTRLATIPLKADEPGIAEAVRLLGIDLVIVTNASEVEVPTESRCSRATTGFGSVAEAAALAAGTRLLAPRSSTGRATCALAEITA